MWGAVTYGGSVSARSSMRYQNDSTGTRQNATQGCFATPTMVKIHGQRLLAAIYIHVARRCDSAPPMRAFHMA